MVTGNPGALKRHDSECGPAQGWPLGFDFAVPRRRIPVAAPSRSRSVVAVLGAFALVMTGLMGDGAKAASLVDSANRTVEVPANVGVVVPAGAPAQILLHALVPERLGGLVEPFKPEHVIYVDPKVRDLPQIPMLNRTAAPGDVAMVSNLKPGLVVDYGSASARYAAADEKIQKELGVPAVLYDGHLGEAAHTVRALGSALGAGPRADVIAGLIASVLTQTGALAELADQDRIAVYLARGNEGLEAARTGTSFDEPIRLAGGRNVVESGNGTFKKMSVEDVVALHPAVVIFSDRDALSSPLHAALPKGTRFVLDTGEPYRVLTGPPSLNRLVGLAALAAILHPETFKMVPDDIARVETTLFPIPPGLAEPAPLQVFP